MKFQGLLKNDFKFSFHKKTKILDFEEFFLKTKKKLTNSSA